MSFPIWLPATLLAGGVQAWRTAVQRRVSKQLSVNAAGLVRYLYGLPFALMLLGGYRLIFPGPLPSPDPRFLLFCLGGGLAQIIATNLLIMAFAHRNFVVGTAYSKTEAVQGAILSFLLMGERLHPLAWAGIGCGVMGVMLLSTGGKRTGFLRALGQPAALCGIASGCCPRSVRPAGSPALRRRRSRWCGSSGRSKSPSPWASAISTWANGWRAAKSWG